jgi:hypothetical protein
VITKFSVIPPLVAVELVAVEVTVVVVLPELLMVIVPEQSEFTE